MKLTIGASKPICFAAIALCSALTSIAQPSFMSANFALAHIFGTNACVAKCDVKLRSDSFKDSYTMNFALLDGKIRWDLDASQIASGMMPPAALRQGGVDQQVIIMRPDLKLNYFIFPRLKSYFKRALTGTDASLDPKIDTATLGKETIEQHPCMKTKIIITTADREKHELIAWLAADLNRFPLRIQNEERGTIQTITFTQIQFIKPDSKEFDPPPQFAAYDDFMKMMEKTQQTFVPDQTSTNIPDRRFTALIDFTIRFGTNRFISSASAKALGLGDETISVMQIAVGRKDEAPVRTFGISSRNSNDLFVATIDRNTLAGVVWLTSPTGIIRSTVLTSSNATRVIVQNESHADQLNQELEDLVAFVTPPPWEDAPHPLNVAAAFGSVSDVEAVFKRDKTALNGLDDEGMTPVASAVVQEQLEVVRFLLVQGADPNIPNKNGLTPLDHACGREKVGVTLSKVLLDAGAQVNPTNHSGSTPLGWAVSSDNIELVKLLIERGANVKAATENGDTALHSAANGANVQIAELLIAHGAEVNAKITGGTTPLHNAAWTGNAGIINLLLSKGAEPDAKRADGVTPLF